MRFFSIAVRRVFDGIDTTDCGLMLSELDQSRAKLVDAVDEEGA